MAYYLQVDDREVLDGLRRNYLCAVCFGRLEARYDLARHLPYVQCRDHPEHEGIALEYKQIEYNMEAKREFMTQDHGDTVAVALRRFDAITKLDKKTSTEIIEVLFPGAGKASPAEFQKALGLCVDYGLDPRLNELFMIPFNKKDENGNIVSTTWTTVQAIKSTRKIASRKHHYSYLDLTPRIMTQEEEVKVFGSVDKNTIRFITKLKDLDTGAEASGFGEWLRKDSPKGTDKGNSRENMSGIRSEKAAINRLYPTEMPDKSIPVVDERYVDAEYRVLPDKTGQVRAEVKKPVVEKKTTGPAANKTGSDPGDIDWDDLRGHADQTASAKVQPGPGGEVTMNDDEQKKAIAELRERIEEFATKLNKIYDDKKQRKFPVTRIMDIVNNMLDKPVQKLSEIPEDKVSQIANTLADYIAISE